MRIERVVAGVLATGALTMSTGYGVLRDPATPAPLPAKVAACFAPGTDPGYVARVYSSVQATNQANGIVAPPFDFQFNLNFRWSSTATNAGPLAQGAPTTLTWSVVPDGTFIPGGGFSPDVGGPSNLRARLNQIYGSQATWQPLVQQALDEWGTRTGTVYLFEPNDDGAGFPSPTSLGAPGQLGTRGDIRLSGRNIDGNNGVLAFNWYPNAGDMVIDTNDSFFATTTTNSLRLRNVLSHEHGHGLGIDHVCPINQTKLMEPFFSASFTGPQQDDILAGNRGYGDDGENNDTTATATDLGTLGNGTTTRNGLSLDASGDLDFFRFNVPAGKQIDVVVTPTGTTYPQGPVSPQTGQCPGTTPPNFNALAQVNPAIQVLASNGTTVIASASTQPAGVAETIDNLALPGAGTFFIRVSGSPDSVQMYNLSLTVEGGVDLGITKTDGVASAVPGQPVTYTIVASNANTTTAANGATVTDTFPAALTGVTWSCSATPGSACGAPSGAGSINQAVNLAPSGAVTFSAQGTIASTATGTLVNTAAVTVPPGLSDPVPANNTATDTDTLTPQANLGITKTDGQPTAIPGAPVTYTIVASNAGPSAVTAAPVTDTFPATLTGVTWTCTATPGSTCAAPSGAGNVSTTVTLLPSGSATFSATGTISPTATGTVANTATVTPPAGVTDPTPANNSATDTDTLTPTANVSVTKTDGQAAEIPGTPVTYTIAVSNAGPSASGPATIADSFPASISGVTWTCSATPGSTCPANGAGNISTSVSLAPAGVATFTATGLIAASATGTLSNTATVTPSPTVTDPTPGDNSATDTDTLTPQSDFRITKTDGQLRATPGAPISYTIQVSNGGPSQSPPATVTDTFPAAITGVSWTCSATPGSTCPVSGAGNINASVSLLPGGAAAFVTAGTVSPSATGSLTNTATITAPGAVTDPEPLDNSATDTDNITLDVQEIAHGSVFARDLRGAGPAAARHFYWLDQKPYSSYEAVVDATSGDVGPALGLDRVQGDGSTVVQASGAAGGIGPSRRLAWVHDGPASDGGQLLRVQSGGCGSDCGADDVYRIRFRETTGRIPRFNNSTTQSTFLILENPTSRTVQGFVYFWRTDGTLAAKSPISIVARGSVVVNTVLVPPGLAGTSGSVTVVHDGGYGGIVGKAVALEASTGFSFDAPLVPVAP